MYLIHESFLQREKFQSPSGFSPRSPAPSAGSSSVLPHTHKHTHTQTHSCPAQVSAGMYSSFYWSCLHFTDCGLKPLMQPFLCLHLPSSHFHLYTSFIFSPTSADKWCFPLLHSPSVSPLTFHYTLFISVLLLYLTPLSPPWRYFHSSGSHFISLFLFLSVLLSFPSLSLILQSFSFFLVFNTTPDHVIDCSSSQAVQLDVHLFHILINTVYSDKTQEISYS